ncbi:hypothetical protein OI70_01995 [Dickeya fangzhongdai]|nr:hypothetical protein OI70_01995 [Dickeya fangzhongdai]
MLNPTLTFRPLAQPAAFPLTGASPAPASPFFARSNDFAYSNDNFAYSNDDVTAQPNETGRHQPAHADAIPPFQTKTHAYGSRRPGFVSVWATNPEPRSGRRLIT